MVTAVVIGSDIDIVMISRENGDTADHVRGTWTIAMTTSIFLTKRDRIGIPAGDLVTAIPRPIEREYETMITMIGRLNEGQGQETEVIMTDRRMTDNHYIFEINSFLNEKCIYVDLVPL